MSRTIPFYCSCSVCTQIRNENPTQYRYTNLLRYLLACSCCSPNRKLIIEEQERLSLPNTSRISTITFRDIDINNKHCSKHDVMVKASRPYFSKIKIEQIRQRVKDANKRWTRMSILPANFIDFIFKNKDFLPLCTMCYRNLSALEFNLCHLCITNLINYQQTNISRIIINNDIDSVSIIPNTAAISADDEDISAEISEMFIDYIQ